MDKDLDQLRDEIIEVTRALRELTGATREFNQLQREVKDNADEFADNTKKVDANTRAQAELNRQYKENGTILDQYGRVLVDGTKKNQEAAQSAKEKAAADREAAEASRRFKSNILQDLGRALEAVGQAALQTALNLQRGAKGLTAYDGQIQNLASAAKGVVGNLSALGPLAGGFGKALNLGGDAITGLALAATDMGQRLYDGFGALNRSGGAAADGLTGLFQDAKSLGLSMSELNALTDAVGQRSQDFALFGGTVFEARRRLGQMGDAMRENREQFLSLGMTMPEVTEGMANYIALQGRLGRNQNRTTEELAASTRRYLLEQDALTKLLGVTRQQQEEAQQRALLNEQFLAKVRQLELQGDTEAANRLLNLSKMYAAVGPETEAAFHGIVTGNLAMEASVKGFVASQGELDRTTQAVINGQMSEIEAFQQTGRAMGRYQDTVGIYTAQMNTNSDIAVKLAEQQRIRILTDANLTEKQKEIALEQIKMGADSAKAQDPLLAGQAKLINTQIATNEALDKMAFQALPVVQDALQGLTEAALAAAEGLGRLAEPTERDEAAIQENTQALLALAPELGKARAEYAKQFKDASITQKMGFGRTEEQRAAAADLNRLERQEQNLKLNIKRAQKSSPGRAGGLATEGFFDAEPVEAPEADTAAPGGAAGPRSSGYTERDLGRMGLRIKGGYTQEPGRFIQSNTIQVAQEAQRLSGFQRITGFNDAYHQGTDSLHTEGRAFDFTLRNRPTPQEGAEIIAQLMGKGASSVKDEYNHPSRRATAGHIHVELPAMARGGITEGPSIAGEAGPEAVVPLPDGRTIPVEFNTQQTASEFAEKAAIALAKRSVPGLRQADTLRGAAQNPTAGNMADVIGLLNPGLGRTLGQAVQLGEVATDGSSAIDKMLDVMGILVPKFAILRTAFDQLQRFMPDQSFAGSSLPQAEIGTSNLGSDISIEIGNSIKDVMATDNAEVANTLREVKDEFTTALNQVVTSMQQQQDPKIQMEILDVLNSINRSQTRTADASQRLAQVATN